VSQVLSLRHRGAGKLLLPVTALPASLTVLALKKVMLYSSSSSSRHSKAPEGTSSAHISDVSDHSPPLTPGNTNISRQSQQQQQQQQQGHVGVGLQLDSSAGVESAAEVDSSELSHAITSPGFTRAALTGSISSADLPAFAAAAAAAAGKSAATDSAAEDFVHAPPKVLLPKLRRLHLKLCFVPSSALTALLGVPVNATQHQEIDANSSRGGVRPALEVLSVTGDGVLRGEASEAWTRWLQALGHLRALQVCACGFS
jgi:hypothetical protein